MILIVGFWIGTVFPRIVQRKNNATTLGPSKPGIGEKPQRPESRPTASDRFPPATRHGTERIQWAYTSTRLYRCFPVTTGVQKPVVGSPNSLARRVLVEPSKNHESKILTLTRSLDPLFSTGRTSYGGVFGPSHQSQFGGTGRSACELLERLVRKTMAAW